MARENNKGGITTVGISSLLTIFAVLCLVVFTLLTVSSARAAQTLSDKAAASVLNYYQADLEAEKTLAQLRAGKVPAEIKRSGNCHPRIGYSRKSTTKKICQSTGVHCRCKRFYGGQSTNDRDKRSYFIPVERCVCEA